MDMSRSQASNLGDSVLITDPDWPWTIQAQTELIDGRPVVTKLTVESRDGSPITSTVLSQIPTRQLANVAASLVAGEGEASCRMLALPKPKGSRTWPIEHFYRVARVAQWARSIGRPGGAVGAVAEFWGVHPRTAQRWISRGAVGRGPAISSN